MQCVHTQHTLHILATSAGIIGRCVSPSSVGARIVERATRHAMQFPQLAQKLRETSWRCLVVRVGCSIALVTILQNIAIHSTGGARVWHDIIVSTCTRGGGVSAASVHPRCATTVGRCRERWLAITQRSARATGRIRKTIHKRVEMRSRSWSSVRTRVCCVCLFVCAKADG